MTRISFRLTLMILLLTFTGVLAQKAQAQESVVKLTIDYGDGVETHYTNIPWKSGMTVFDSMELARKRRKGLKFEKTGSEATLFIKSIEDLPNEGSGSGKRNWIYRINGKLARQGAGVQTLESGDSIVWAYTTSGLKP